MTLIRPVRVLPNGAVEYHMSTGIYLHVPFCRRKCGYCDFYSVAPDRDLVQLYMHALIKEMELRGPVYEGSRFTTLYIGGGTPSLLSVSDLSTVLDGIKRHFTFSPAEITLECNPFSSSEKYFTELKSLGINRLSLGVQALDDRLLELLGRSHGVEEVYEAVSDARAAGFDNISFDLIYGIPGQSPADWRRSLEKTVSLQPDHISAYELSFPEGTDFGILRASGRLNMSGESETAEMYGFAAGFFGENGLPRYEISNFARTGKECLHNLNYWRRGCYLGLGPSAHSFMNGRRFWNVSSVDGYTLSLSRGKIPLGQAETPTVREAAFERVMLALRTAGGIAMSDVPAYMEELITPHISSGLVEVEGQRLRLSERGIMLSNEVFLRLMKG